MLAQQNVKSRSATRTTSLNQTTLFFVCKRSIDIVGSLFLIIMLIPAFIVISYWLYKKEGKPLFFRELRMGKNNRPFIMWSFRTKTIPSQVIRTLPPRPVPLSWDDGVPNEFTLKTYGYNTITDTGNSLRKYNLHKIPQLFHVLKGEMSLVGPEAEIPAITKYYNDYQVQRQTVKPGMTGYAQINNCSNRDHQQKITNDIYYIEHCSHSLDMKIIFQAIKKSIRANHSS